MHHLRSKSAIVALAVGALSTIPLTSAFAGAPPSAATAFSSAVIGADGGSVSGFGMTATFAPGALAQTDLVILGSWPNGLDVTPPAGQAVKTFGLQVCTLVSGTPTTCTSEFGNYPTSPGGIEKINGSLLTYTAFQKSVSFGSLTNKLVTISINTGGDSVYVYNPNFSTNSNNQAYPKLLPSTASNGVLTFKTFQPIVWTVTSPLN